jgi:hypothetical protein
MPATQTPVPPRTARRRAALVISAGVIAVLGLVLHFLSLGDLAGLITDALYTVLLYLLLGVIAPRAARLNLGLASFAISAAIELLQLTGVPAQLAGAFPASRLLLGTTFSAPDLVAYAVGAAAAWAADAAISRQARPQCAPSRLE